MNQENKLQEYEKVLELLDHFLQKYQILGQNAIQTSIQLIVQFDSIFDDHLEVGPYQSTILATPRIEKGKAQCGQCWSEGTVQIQEDVKVCQNYIACDNETQSEIVIPVLKNGVVQSVLDIDSEQLSRFDEVDSNIQFDKVLINDTFLQVIELRPTFMTFDLQSLVIQYFALAGVYWMKKLQLKQIQQLNKGAEIYNDEVFYAIYNDEVYYESMENIQARLTLIQLVFFHSLLYISSHWSISMKSKIRYFPVIYKLIQNQVKNYKFLYQSDAVTIHPDQSNKYFMERVFYDETKELFIGLKPNIKFILQNLERQEKQRKLNIWCFLIVIR